MSSTASLSTLGKECGLAGGARANSNPASSVALLTLALTTSAAGGRMPRGRESDLAVARRGGGGRFGDLKVANFGGGGRAGLLGEPTNRRVIYTSSCSGECTGVHKP